MTLSPTPRRAMFIRSSFCLPTFYIHPNVWSDPNGCLYLDPTLIAYSKSTKERDSVVAKVYILYSYSYIYNLAMNSEPSFQQGNRSSIKPPKHGKEP